jgi:4-amino-4-deoxy-L-arabinose transferase-like glycosyltransferase
MTMAAFEDQRQSRDHQALEVVFGWVLISILVTSIGALLLAELGRFSLMGTILLVTGYLVALILIRLPRLDPVERWRELKWDRSQMLALGLLLVTAGLFFRPFENIFGGRDGGVYVNTGINVAKTGSIHIGDDFFAKLPQETQEKLMWVPAPVQDPEYRAKHPGFYYFKYPGFHWVENERKLIPQGLHLYAVWIALFYATFGLTGSLFVTPLFALLTIAGLYLVGRILFKPEVGLVALILMMVNASQIWFARYANADVLFQCLFVGGLLYWARFIRDNRRFLGTITGICFGTALFTKIDAGPSVVPLVVIFGYLALRRWERKFWSLLVPLGLLAGWAAVHGYFFSWPVYAFITPQLLFRTFLFLMFPLGIFVVALAFRGTELMQGSLGLLSANRRPFTLALALIIVTSGFYMYFILPRGFNLFSGIDRLLAGPYPEPKQNFVELGWYLTPLGLFLAVIGAAQITVERWDRETILFLLSAFVFSVVNLRFFSMAWSDHIWAIRRYISVVMPSGALFMAYAIVRLGQALRGNRILRTFPMVMVVILVARLIQLNWPIITNQEFAGAIVQAQELAEALPERAVVIFDGSWVGNFLAPPLTFIHDKETVVFWPEEGEGPFDLESVEAVATRGFAEGREVFFVSTHEILPFSASYELYPVRAATLKVPQLEHTLDHFPQKIERWELPYRVYSLQPATGSMSYEAEILPHEVGRVVEDGDASWGQAMYANPAKDSRGALCYGPYVTIPKGRYRALFRLEVGEGDSDRPVVVVDVAADTGKTILARKEIAGHDFTAQGRYQAFALDFDNPITQTLEFRVHFTGAVELWVDNIEVLRSHIKQ